MSRQVQHPAVPTHESRRPAPTAARWHRAGAWAGVAGPVAFVALVLVQDLLRADRSPVADPVSALAAGPGGWVQQLAFIVLGLLAVPFAVALHRSVRRARFGVVGPALLALTGVMNVIAVAFPMQEADSGAVLAPPGHVVAGTVFFSTAALSLLALAPRLARDPLWRGLARYTLIAGAVAAASFPVMGLLVVPDSAPLHEWYGLAQRAVVFVVVLPARVLLAVRLLEVTHARVWPEPAQRRAS